MDETDPRPPVWIDHVVLATSNLRAAHEFTIALGLRANERSDGAAIYERPLGKITV